MLEDTTVTITIFAAPSLAGWKRFWRRLAAIEEDLSLGYEGWQDRRIARLEAELRALAQQVSALR